MSKTYEIAWVKNYHMGNSVLIEAETEEEALEIARDNIGNYEGSMQYDPDEDWVESWGERGEPSEEEKSINQMKRSR